MVVVYTLPETSKESAGYFSYKMGLDHSHLIGFCEQEKPKKDNIMTEYVFPCVIGLLSIIITALFDQSNLNTLI